MGRNLAMQSLIPEVGVWYSAHSFRLYKWGTEGGFLSGHAAEAMAAVGHD